MKLGQPATEVLADVEGKAAAIVAIGSCAAWGGIPSADPNSTGAVGVADLLSNQTVIDLPGCPPNPYTLFGVVLHFVPACCEEDVGYSQAQLRLTSHNTRSLGVSCAVWSRRRYQSFRTEHLLGCGQCDRSIAGRALY
jgi:coenzyme F420-reducing hydrogenase gamma subunit